MRRFPWNTLATLGLGTYGLVLLTILWWRGWYQVFPAYIEGEQWIDFVVIHGGLLYLASRWIILGRALWDRWTP